MENEKEKERRRVGIWDNLGAILALLGAIYMYLGAFLGPSGPWSQLGAILGHLGAMLGYSGPILGLSWGYLGLYWAILNKSFQDISCRICLCLAPQISGHFGVHFVAENWQILCYFRGRVVLGPRTLEG